LALTVALWQRGGLSWGQVLVRSWRAYHANQFGARSAQYAYYALLSVFPLLILLVTGVAHLPLADVVEGTLEVAGKGLPQEVHRLFAAQARDIQRQSSTGLVLASSLVLAIAGSRLFVTISNALNSAYGVVETRRFFKVYGQAFLLNVAASILGFVAMVLLVVGPMAARWVADLALPVGALHVLLQSGVRWSVVAAFLWIYTSTIYYVAPNVRLAWYWLSPGCVIATAGWIGVSQGFRLYVENLARYNETYGAIGGGVVLLIGFDLTGALLLFGGQVNAVIHQAATRREQSGG
jgi:membrane protein